MPKIFTTRLKAIDPKDGILKDWSGERIVAETEKEAIEWCSENRGYLKVDGQLEEELEMTKEDWKIIMEKL